MKVQKSQTISMAQKILVYPEQVKQYRQKFLKRNKIQQFKKITQKQIALQYKVLASAEFHNEQETIYLKNINKNRYSDILVYHHSRVQCASSENYYVNASNMVSIIDGNNFAIFSQAPPPSAFNQFWQAIYEKNVKLIIMLCSFHCPKRGRQSQQYWPEKGKQMKINQLKLKIQTKEQKKISQDLTVSNFLMKGEQGQKTVKHIHWTGWADLKQPLGQQNQKLFLDLVNECLNCIQKKQMFLIHCSAGIGRTGTLGTVIEAIRCAKLWKQLSVFQIVQNLRKNRMYCVQTFEQYKFIYQELNKYFQQKKI